MDCVTVITAALVVLPPPLSLVTVAVLLNVPQVLDGVLETTWMVMGCEPANIVANVQLRTCGLVVLMVQPGTVGLIDQLKPLM